MARDPFAEIVARLAELERRMGNVCRTVKVTESMGDGRVRVSDGAGFEPEPLPQASLSAGDWSFDAPADVGAPGIVICPEGDPTHAFFLPCLPSGDKPHASTDPGTLRLKGKTGEVIEISGGVISITSGGNGIIIDGSEVRTNCRTRLNNGTKKVHRVDDRDSADDTATEGADDVFA